MSRESLLPLLMGHVLEHGLGQASLRPLAKGAGTSDRMLLYHFGTKERLIADLLSYIAGVYAGMLEGALTGQDRPATRSALLERILTQNAEPAMAPFMQLWWEIVAGSARGVPGFREAAQAMMAELVGWLELQMPQGDRDPAGGARYLLTVIEGAGMLAAVGHDTTAHQGLLAGGLLPS